MKIYSALVPKAIFQPEAQPGTAATGFGQLFTQLMQQTIDQQVQANQMSSQLALGETDDVQAVMVATEKASLSWQLLQQVTNKLMDAYQEIMRMQV